MTTFIISIAVALGVSFLCSIMEAALLSITPSKIAMISEKSPLIGRLCNKFKQDIEKPIAVILILNTAAHTFGASIAGAQFDKLFGSSHIWLFSLIFTLVMVQYTEILPKTLGVRFNAPVVRTTAPALNLLISMMRPLIWLVHFINRPFAVRHGQDEEAAALTEIRALATMARQTKQISQTQEQIIRNAPTLGKRTIEELMQPFSEVCIIPESYSRAQILELIQKNLHTRYPVCRKGDGSCIIGSLNVKDLLFNTQDWHRSIKPVTFISIRIPQLELIENVLKFDSKLLMVRDAQGKTVGMLTVNDVLLELLGKEYPDDAAATA